MFSASWILGWLVRQMAGPWMSWRMGFRCVAELNWQSTPQWSVFCTVTGGPDRGVFWRQQDAAKSGDIRSWWAKSAKQVGGVRSGSRGPLVAGIPRSLPPSGGTGLAPPLGLNGVLCGGTGSGRFAAGSPSGSWSGRGHSTGTGCGTGSVGSRFCLVTRSHNFD